MSGSDTPTACVLLIGNEILSGKTQDANLPFLGVELAKLGIRLVEARVIRDEHETIAAHVNECRTKYTYVFTTGGIGPTHDDITAEAVALAFGVELPLNDQAVELLRRSGRELTDARLRMARIPAGASLIENSVSNAPGFRIGNVFVMAGVPHIARAMFAAAARELTTAEAIQSRSLKVYALESDIAAPLTRIANTHPDVEIGSYPFREDDRYGANLVVRGTDAALIDRVIDEIARATREFVDEPGG
jgi:molybdenum cofactor synthesis domain-containing protein